MNRSFAFISPMQLVNANSTTDDLNDSQNRFIRQKIAKYVYSDRSFGKIQTKRAWSSKPGHFSKKSRRNKDFDIGQSMYNQNFDEVYRSYCNVTGPADYQKDNDLTGKLQSVSRFRNGPAFSLRPALNKGKDYSLSDVGRDVPKKVGPGMYKLQHHPVEKRAPDCGTVVNKKKRFEAVYDTNKYMKNVPHTYHDYFQKKKKSVGTSRNLSEPKWVSQQSETANIGSPLKNEKEKLLKSLYASSRISQKSVSSNKTNVRYSVFCGNFRNN